MTGALTSGAGEPHRHSKDKMPPLAALSPSIQVHYQEIDVGSRRRKNLGLGQYME